MNPRLKILVFIVALLCAVTLYAQSPTPTGIFNVRDFGASGDGKTLDTAAISSAISAAAKSGGGTVLFPPGAYLTGTFQLRSNITLDLESGAVIRGSSNLADYGSIADYGLARNYGVNSSGEGTRVGIIFGRNVENVAIMGRGTIDGSGDDFFDFTKPHYSLDFDPVATRQGSKSEGALQQISDGPVAEKPAGRPGTMIACFDCRNVLMRDITLRNAPNWTVHLQDGEHAIVSGVHILNDPLLPNNDGFDCFGCTDVHFSDCDIYTGDDDFAIVNSRDISIANCALSSRSSAIRLEATSYSTFSGISIHSNRGIAIYERGAGKTDHLVFSNIAIETQLFGGHWWGKAEPIYVVAAKPVAPGEGVVSGVLFSNITGESESSIVLFGSSNAPIQNLTFSNVHFTLRATRKDVSDAVGGNFDFRWTATDRSQAVFKHDIPGLYARYVDGLRLRDFSIAWSGENPGFFSSAIQLEDFSDVIFDGFEGRQATGSAAPVISLTRGSGATIRGSRAAAGSNAFVFTSHVRGEGLFSGNDVSQARRVFARDPSRFKSYGNDLPALKTKTTRR